MDPTQLPALLQLLLSQQQAMPQVPDQNASLGALGMQQMQAAGLGNLNPPTNMLNGLMGQTQQQTQPPGM